MKILAEVDQLKLPSKQWMCLSLVFGLIGACAGRAFADDGAYGDLAVSSLAMRGYVRTVLANGSFAKETYVIGQSGILPTCISDYTLDKVSLEDVVQIAAKALSKQNYLPASDPNTAKLLIKIYWGTTAGVDPDQYHPEKQERLNAIMMGYESAYAKATEYRRFRPTLRWRTSAIMEEFRGGSVGRYFVVLIAYDYQRMRNEKTQKPLWLTRFSIPTRGYAFNEALPAMALDASKYFGQTTDGLTHKDLNKGDVILGDLKALGTEP